MVRSGVGSPGQPPGTIWRQSCSRSKFSPRSEADGLVAGSAVELYSRIHKINLLCLGESRTTE